MHINRHNYEAFLLDYFEGNLKEEDKLALKKFLAENPELNADFDDLSEIKLEEEITASIDKSGLFKASPIQPNNIDDYLINDLEGLSSFNEKKELEDFLSKNPSHQKDRELYALTILKADSYLKYQKKKALKRKPGFAIWRAAAAVILLLGIGFSFYLLFSDKHDEQLAANLDNTLPNEANAAKQFKSKESAALSKQSIISSAFIKRPPRSHFHKRSIEIETKYELATSYPKTAAITLDFEAIKLRPKVGEIQKSHLENLEPFRNLAASSTPKISPLETPANNTELNLWQYIAQKTKESIFRNQENIDEKSSKEALAFALKSELGKQGIELKREQEMDGLAYHISIGDFEFYTSDIKSLP